VTRSPLWREFESGDTSLLRGLRFLILAGGVLFLIFAAVLDLTWQHQLVLAALTLALAAWVDRSSKSYQVTLTLLLLSVYSTVRYGVWRVSSVVGFFRNPGTHWSWLDAFFICLLLLAECYAFAVLVLGYLQMLWPLRRAPVPLPDDPEDWPAVDLLIPTYDEPLSVVRFTALAAMNIDWPAEKLNVYILDDGRREEFRAFAEEAGIGYMARDDNRHAKAGNINSALERVDSPFVTVFDCDHVPTRSFLQLTMGWFLRDQKLAVLQTPHHSYSPDPFDRNLDQFRAIPNEDELFYRVVQDGNDFWNAAFFCGSCAVLRRSALNEVGGVAVETVTEDAHTSLRLQSRGWNTAYINIPQAAGLATERLSAHVRQRIRWARGMVQILRIENPLFVPGLKPAQRLCYFNAMSHFLYALPRLIFLTAPLIYLIFGKTNIPGLWIAIVAYALPHLVLSNLTNSRMQGQYRHSFWNEIYETVLAPYILLPTLLALIHPKLGKFNVTAKGGTVEEDYFDARIARPFLLLMAFNFFGLLCAIPRFFQFRTVDAPGWLQFLNWPAQIYDGGHAGTIWVNVVWTLFNLTILGVATAVSWETRQRRETVRVAMAVPSDVILADGSMIQGITSDLSGGGVRTRLDGAVTAQVGDPIRFVFPLLDGTAMLPARVVGIDGNEVRAQFGPLSLQEDEALTMLLYSRADAWLGLDDARQVDRPLRSIGRILRLSLRGFWHTLGGGRGRKGSPKTRLVTSIAPVILLGLLAGVSGLNARAAQGVAAPPVRAGTAGPAQPAPTLASAGSFDTIFTLRDAGVPSAITLHGVDASHSIYFSVARNRLVKTATMKLRYHLSPGLLPGVSQLNVSLNGTMFASLAAGATPSSGNQTGLLEATLNLPTDLLVHDNQLTFEFIGHYAPQCEDPSNSTLWAQVDPNSTIELAGTFLPLTNDLSLLPLPFYDAGVNSRPTVPIVFLTQPSAKAMQAAGIVASWFGILNGPRPVQFPVSFGAIPAGNTIVIAENAAQIPASLGVAAVSGPTVAMLANPSDPTSNVLLVAGSSEDELLTAARALVLHGETWQGPRALIQDFTLPDPRKADDAPRWLSTDKNQAVNLGQITETDDLQGDGSVPLAVYMRIPPDLYFGERQNVAFHLSYRYDGVPLGAGSTLQVTMNGAYVSSTPLPHQDKASMVLETVVPIPVVDLRPFSNSMMLNFTFQPAKDGRCAAAMPANLQGAVLKDSHLDITDIPHWTQLPNLELFANAGYPFTRKADLADTTVVLPDQPSAGELEMFLTLMGHFGAQTGYPVLSVTVTNAAGMSSDGRKDYLVMGAAEDQPALKTLDRWLPVGVDEGGLHVRDLHGLFDRFAWWRAGSGTESSGLLETGGGLPDALIEGFELPSGSKRSVVVIVVRDETAISKFLGAFLKTSQSSDISQSVSVLHDAQFASYRIGNGAYWSGDISPLMHVTLIFQRFPWLIAIVAVIFCFLMAVLIQAKLRRLARERLQGGE
jgi:cellulose synthase (UDP-forming)